jgi:hypothetical protein
MREQIEIAFPACEPIPVERVRDGVRFCAHHPDQSIAGRGYPCALCRKAGKGLGAPVVDEEEVGGGERDG